MLQYSNLKCVPTGPASRCDGRTLLFPSVEVPFVAV
jgi:hypothetical protein